MNLGRPLLFAVLAAATAGTAEAYVLIDDFTVGDYHTQVDWPRTFDAHRIDGLDKSHAFFGNRITELRIMTNFDRVPVFIDVGGGAAKITHNSPTRDIATRFSTRGLADPGAFLDLSDEDEIWLDVSSEDPPDRWADKWSIQIRDANNLLDSNGAWLLRQGGIYFRKSDFEPGLDWTKIVDITFSQEFTPDLGTVPTSYAVTRFYVVPEPSLVWLFVLAALGGIKAARRKPPGH